VEYVSICPVDIKNILSSFPSGCFMV
jgi:hypothetical protein